MVELLRSVTDQPVRYVVNTHYHQDHSGSNARFKAAGADIVMTAQARERMVEVNQSGLPRFTMKESARIHIGGEVFGNVTIEDKAELGQYSTLDGDLIYKQLLIEEGAKFQGQCTILNEISRQNSLRYDQTEFSITKRVDCKLCMPGSVCAKYERLGRSESK